MTAPSAPAIAPEQSAVDTQPPPPSPPAPVEETHNSDDAFSPTPVPTPTDSRDSVTQVPDEPKVPSDRSRYPASSKYNKSYQDKGQYQPKYSKYQYQNQYQNQYRNQYRNQYQKQEIASLNEAKEKGQQPQPDQGYTPEAGRKYSKNFINRNFATGKMPTPLASEDQFDLTPNERIRRPENLKHLQNIIAYNARMGNKLTIVWFCQWGLLACKRIYAQVQKCADLYKATVNMIEVDVSDDKKILKHYHVRGTPSFLFFLDGAECEGERIHDGLPMQELDEKIKRLSKLSKKTKKSVGTTHDKDAKADVGTKARSQSQSIHQSPDKYQNQGKYENRYSDQNQDIYQSQKQSQNKISAKQQDNDSLEDDNDLGFYRPQTAAELAMERYGGDPDSWDMEAPFKLTRPSASQQAKSSKSFQRQKSYRDHENSLPSVQMSHNPQSRKVCTYFVRGKCSYGNDCIYRHLSGEAAEAYRVDKPEPKKVPICKYFSIGKCFYGDKCWLVHDRSSQKKPAQNAEAGVN